MLSLGSNSRANGEIAGKIADCRGSEASRGTFWQFSPLPAVPACQNGRPGRRFAHPSPSGRGPGRGSETETASAVFPAQRVLGPCFSTVVETASRQIPPPNRAAPGGGGGRRDGGPDEITSVTSDPPRPAKLVPRAVAKLPIGFGAWLAGLRDFAKMPLTSRPRAASIVSTSSCCRRTRTGTRRPAGRSSTTASPA